MEIIWWWAIIMVWSAIWKGFALWRAGRKNQMVWFIVMFILNTAGILEILYLFVFSGCCKKKMNAPAVKKAAPRKKRRR
jgi:hypothetical protein